MRKCSIACGAAMLALSLAGTAHADEWNKLTYLTFSGPVQLPGVTLPAGTYRFELADPNSDRRVVRVSDKDGSKNYGIFLSVPDQKLQPSSDPAVMFKETPSGAAPAVQAWFYPGETYGYEFVYAHDQALKIAKANHASVLAMKDTPKASTDEENRSAMTAAEVTRIDENDKAVSTDEALKDSSTVHPSNTTAAASNTASATAANANTAANMPAAATAGSSPVATQTSTSATTAGSAMPAPQASAAQTTTAKAEPARSTTANERRAVGTSGTQAPAASDTAPTAAASRAKRRALPRTAGELPLYELLSGLAFAGSFALRAFRR